MTHPSVLAMWHAYQERRAALAPGSRQTAGPSLSGTSWGEPSAWHFCDNPADADECAQLVLEGKKRATSPAVAELALRGDAWPRVGDLHVITNWVGEAQCIIRTVAVTELRFGDVTAEHAALEGEGDGSLEFWRRVHREYYGRVLDGTESVVSDDLLILFEQFEVVFKASG